MLMYVHYFYSILCTLARKCVSVQRITLTPVALRGYVVVMSHCYMSNLIETYTLRILEMTLARVDNRFRTVPRPESTLLFVFEPAM